MATRKPKGTAGEKKAREFMKLDSFKILRSHEFDNGNVSFDAVINGITLYRLTVVSRKDGSGEFISFPSYENNGKWYNYCYMALSEEDSDKIVQAVYDSIDDE